MADVAEWRSTHVLDGVLALLRWVQSRGVLVDSLDLVGFGLLLDVCFVRLLLRGIKLDVSAVVRISRDELKTQTRRLSTRLVSLDRISGGAYRLDPAAWSWKPLPFDLLVVLELVGCGVAVVHDARIIFELGRVGRKWLA